MLCPVSQSEAFQRDLVIMERVVNLNTYQPKLASYRDFVIVEGTVFHVLWVTLNFSVSLPVELVVYR